MGTAVKICGITRVDDALAAARLGAQALGFVFYAQSPRLVTRPRAAEVLGDGASHRLIRRRETYADLVRAEVEV